MRETGAASVYVLCTHSRTFFQFSTDQSVWARRLIRVDFLLPIRCFSEDTNILTLAGGFCKHHLVYHDLLCPHVSIQIVCPTLYHLHYETCFYELRSHFPKRKRCKIDMLVLQYQIPSLFQV